MFNCFSKTARGWSVRHAIQEGLLGYLPGSLVNRATWVRSGRQGVPCDYLLRVSMGAQTPVGGAVLQLRGCCMGLQGQGLRVVLCSNNLSGRKAWCSLGSLSGEIRQCEPLVAPQRA